MSFLRRISERAVDRLQEAIEARAARRYAVAPICATPIARADEYRRVWVEAQGEPYPVVDAYEAACGAAIDPAWFQTLALLTQVPIKQSAICYQHGRLLYATLVRYIRERTSHHLTIIETGTARGFSALCLAKA